MTATQPVFSPKCCLGALLCGIALCGGLLATAAGSPPPPGGNGTWEPAQIAIAPDGTSRVLWEALTSAGDVVSIWKMDSAGNVLAKSVAYGPYSDSNGRWTPAIESSMAVAADGSLSLLWVNSSEVGVEASVWKFDANLNHTATGPAYGPYSDVHGLWTPSQFIAGPNGTTRLLWINNERGGFPALTDANLLKNSEAAKPMTDTTGPEASIWSFDQNGVAATKGPAYGPYSDGDNAWSPIQLAVAPDGSNRLMWTTPGLSTAVSFWTLNSAGAVTHYSPAYGPYANWHAANFDIDSADGTLRLLWLNDTQTGTFGDQASAWTLTTQGVATTMGPAYGPYQYWFANTIYANPDGTSTIEWSQQYNNGISPQYVPISFWKLDSAGRQFGAMPSYGPYFGSQGDMGYGWHAQNFAHNPADGAFRILWDTYSGVGLMSTWSLNSGGGSPTMGPAYGPYTYGG